MIETSRSRPAVAGRLAVSAALVLLFPGAPTAGAEAPEYLVEYRAYNAALESGDTPTALQHGRAAWQAAEQELGDDRLTAILAYNYGRLIVFQDAAAASTALERAQALLKSGIADFAADELDLYAAYAEFAADDTTRREADRLRESLQAFPLEAPDLNPDLATLWLSLAAHDALEERFRRALDSGAMAEQATRAISPGSTQALAGAIVIQAVAHLAPYPRKVRDVQAAHNDIMRARALFGPQEDIDSFDPLLAEIVAWEHATTAALHTLGEESYPDHENSDKGESERTFTFVHQQSVDCPELDWERTAPEYPRRALRKGYIGAALIGYRLGEDGQVYDARILAEVPQATFGEVALEAVRSWHVNEVPDADPACLLNLTTSIQFVIDR